MTRNQFGLSVAPELAERIRSAASFRHMTPPAVIQACVEFYLPVIEAGLHGLPAAQAMFDQWHEDLRQATDHLKTLPTPTRQPQKRRAA